MKYKLGRRVRAGAGARASGRETHIPITIHIYLLSILFLHKKNVEYFSFVKYWAINLFMWWYRWFLMKLLFHDILRMTCHNDVRCASINFHKQKRQPSKLRHLSISALNSVPVASWSQFNKKVPSLIIRKFSF